MTLLSKQVQITSDTPEEVKPVDSPVQSPEKYPSRRDFLNLVIGGLIGLIPFLWEKFNPPPPPMIKLLVRCNVDSATVHVNGRIFSNITKADSFASMGEYEPGDYLVEVKKTGYRLYGGTITLPVGHKTSTVYACLHLQKKALDERYDVIVMQPDGRPKRMKY